MYAFGNYDNSEASAIMIVWERCDPVKNAQSDATKDVVCVTDEEYLEWSKSRYILAIENQKRFIQHKFGDERIVASSEVRWYSLNNESRDDNVNLATRGFLELADEYISVGTDQEEETSFFIERKPKRSLGYDNKF